MTPYLIKILDKLIEEYVKKRYQSVDDIFIDLYFCEEPQSNQNIDLKSNTNKLNGEGWRRRKNWATRRSWYNSGDWHSEEISGDWDSWESSGDRDTWENY
ncbi:hypothetical protein FACHB389_24635 [Nostoc calcicola FACHB-389]|nr:hypothetical protein FACHB389_24635 [Nostoc calcicola FACHB-389]